MMKTNFSFFIIVLLVFVGCREVYTVSVNVVDDSIVFDLSEIEKKFSDEKLIVRTLEITKKNCSINCMMWSIEGDEKSEPIIRMIYGVLPNGMRAAVKSQELTVGKYALSGNIWLLDDAEISGPITILGDFVIE